MNVEQGGMGLHQTRKRNLAAMAKLNWRLLKEKNTTWIRLFWAKYFPSSSPNLSKPIATNPSIVARNISAGWDIFKSGLRYVIHSGESTSLWFDNWLGIGTLRSLLPGPLCISSVEANVQSIIKSNHEWDFEAISFPLPPWLSALFKSIPFSNHSQSKDSIIWDDSANGVFSTKSAYDIQKSDCCPTVQLGWIWKLKIPPKIQSFFWLTCINKLPTKAILRRRHILSEDLCESCFSQESVSHLLWECPRSQFFWLNLGFAPKPLSPDLDFSSWVKLNLSEKKFHRSIPSYLLFAFGCASLWYWRNHRTFRSAFVFCPWSECYSKAREFFHLRIEPSPPSVKQPILIVWEPPPMHSYKLNSDGASKANPGNAGGGGVIRDHRGRWVKGFSRKIGIATSLQAELWALRDGLELALTHNLKPLCVEIDSFCAIKLLTSDSSSHHYDALICDCRWLLKELQIHEVKHVFREGNLVADSLANFSLKISQEFLSMNEPPEAIIPVLQLDCSKVGSKRYVT